MRTYDSTLEIFVLTYNRAKILKETLENLILQTDKSIKITVLDNCSTDNTEDICKSFNSHGIFYAKTKKNDGWHSNADLTKQLATAKWMMMFHDDDFLHPKYCHYVKELLALDPCIALVGSGMSFESEPSNKMWDLEVHSKSKLFRNPTSFARFLYQGFPYCYSSSVFKTSVFKKINYKEDLYGKIFDRPLLLEMAKYGSVYVFEAPFVQYRTHSQQSSGDGKTGPFASQLIAMHELYFKLLGSNILTKEGRTFVANNYRMLRDEYLTLKVKYPNQYSSLIDYLNYAICSGATTRFAIVLGLLLNKISRSFKYLS